MVKNIGVIGCGVMGSGIAQLCAQKGYHVLLSEKDEGLLNKGLEKIGKSLSKLAARGKLSDSERQQVLERIQGKSGLDHLSECELIIEAVTEDLSLKKKIFRTLDRICPAHTIFASNTSVLPISEMASATSRPDKVAGTHFLTPPEVIPLLEIVRTEATSADTLAAVKAFGERLGKVTVTAKDSPGFIVNRILTSIMYNSVRLLEEGVASREDIDTAIRVGLGLPMGGLELLDLIGMDTIVLGSTALYEGTNDPQYICPESIRSMVSTGRLGRKSGEGFYRYDT